MEKVRERGVGVKLSKEIMKDDGAHDMIRK